MPWHLTFNTNWVNNWLDKTILRKNWEQIDQNYLRIAYNWPKFHPKDTKMNKKKLKLTKSTFDGPYLTIIGQLLP